MEAGLNRLINIHPLDRQVLKAWGGQLSEKWEAHCFLLTQVNPRLINYTDTEINMLSKVEHLKSSCTIILGNSITAYTDHISYMISLQKRELFTDAYCYKTLAPLLTK